MYLKCPLFLLNEFVFFFNQIVINAREYEIYILMPYLYCLISRSNLSVCIYKYYVYSYDAIISTKDIIYSFRILISERRNCFYRHRNNILCR